MFIILKKARPQVVSLSLKQAGVMVRAEGKV